MVEKTIALTGISANSIEDAVGLAVARAGVTISGIHTAHVTDTSAVMENNKVVRWKVSVRLTFAVKDQLHESTAYHAGGAAARAEFIPRFPAGRNKSVHEEMKTQRVTNNAGLRIEARSSGDGAQ